MHALQLLLELNVPAGTSVSVQGTTNFTAFVAVPALSAPFDTTSVTV